MVGSAPPCSKLKHTRQGSARFERFVKISRKVAKQLPFCGSGSAEKPVVPLMHFQEHKYAVSAETEGMCRQILFLECLQRTAYFS